MSPLSVQSQRSVSSRRCRHATRRAPRAPHARKEPFGLPAPEDSGVTEYSAHIEIAAVSGEHPEEEVVEAHDRRDTEDGRRERGGEQEHASRPAGPPCEPDEWQQRGGRGLLRECCHRNRGAGGCRPTPYAEHHRRGHQRQHEHFEVRGLRVLGSERGRREEVEHPGGDAAPVRPSRRRASTARSSAVRAWRGRPTRGPARGRHCRRARRSPRRRRARSVASDRPRRRRGGRRPRAPGPRWRGMPRRC